MTIRQRLFKCQTPDCWRFLALEFDTHDERALQHLHQQMRDNNWGPSPKGPTWHCPEHLNQLRIAQDRKDMGTIPY